MLLLSKKAVFIGIILLTTIRTTNHAAMNIVADKQAQRDEDQDRQDLLGKKLITAIAEAGEKIAAAKKPETKQQLEHALAGKIRKLLAEGANVNVYNDITLKTPKILMPLIRQKIVHAVWLTTMEVHDKTALHVAAMYGLTLCLDILLCANADVDWPEGEQTALHYAAANGHLACVEHLVAAGATIDARDSYNLTPLAHAVAAKQAHITAYLLELGASPTLTNQHGQSIVYIQDHPTTKADDNKIAAAITLGTKMNAARHNWAGVAILTAFMRANQKSEIKNSILGGLIGEIRQYAGMGEKEEIYERNRHRY